MSKKPGAIQLVTAGPRVLDNLTWQWLVQTKLPTDSANARFEGPSSEDAGPMWCFDRMGMSQTALPDGRVVHIAGEYEDYYDPDFYIYNDVVIVDPDGSIHIRGYSRTEFPPTDFHSATLVGDTILIIGCIGYKADRTAGTTPVYRLWLDSWRIEPVITTGESPGWLHNHLAELSQDGQTIAISGGTCWLGANRPMIENIDDWSLDVHSGHWRRLTKRQWQCWSMHRSDRKRSRLEDVRFEHWARDNPHADRPNYWTFDDAPNFDALARLYRIDDAAPLPIKSEEEVGEYRTVVDGFTVRITEDYFDIAVVIEGSLDKQRLLAFQARTLAALAELDGAEWVIDQIPELPGGGDSGAEHDSQED